jgi:2-hydroxychromene-2-carboxylate isomerase
VAQPRLYIDVKSPYAYLAVAPAQALEDELGVSFDWRHYTLDIPSYLGSVESRDPHQWRRVRYSYMDARRYANRRGLTLYGPRKIFDSTVAGIGMLFAKDQGRLRQYVDPLFERFWKRELDIEDASVIEALLREAGADTVGFAAYLAGEGRRRHDAERSEAEGIGVFGVPMFVIEGELFWGQDRLDLVRERLGG